jgi:hypothetical protein
MKGSQHGRADRDLPGEPQVSVEPASAEILAATQLDEVTRAEPSAEQQTILRFEQLPRDAGWMLVTAGVVGLVVPGFFGTPFLFAGAFVLVPGGPRLLARWAGRNPPKFVHSAVRQIDRFLNDLERRYPRN